MSLFFSASFPVTLYSFCGFGFVLKVLILLWGIGKFLWLAEHAGDVRQGLCGPFDDCLVTWLCLCKGLEVTAQAVPASPTLQCSLPGVSSELSLVWLSCSQSPPHQQPAFLPVTCPSCPLMHPPPLPAASKKSKVYEQCKFPADFPSDAAI